MSNRAYKSSINQMLEDSRKEKKDAPAKGWVNPYQWKPKKAKAKDNLKIKKKKA